MSHHTINVNSPKIYVENQYYFLFRIRDSGNNRTRKLGRRHTPLLYEDVLHILSQNC